MQHITKQENEAPNIGTYNDTMLETASYKTSLLENQNHLGRKNVLVQKLLRRMRA